MKSSEIKFAFRKRLIINQEFEPLLKKNRLDVFGAVMKFKGGEVVKQQKRGRSTVRFYLSGETGKVLVYLKRYRFALIPEFLKNCLFFFRTYSNIYEWRNILAFKACDIPTMNPVAVGVRWRKPFWNESFLLTEGIPNTVTLEKELANTFSAPRDSERLKQKKVLIDKIAALTQKMHKQGFKHQDFNVYHILVDTTDLYDPFLYIVDLHRARRKKKIDRRWRIKDLASLNHSVPRKIISQTDRLRFLKKYDPQLAEDHSFIKAILKKSEWIQARELKKRKSTP